MQTLLKFLFQSLRRSDRRKSFVLPGFLLLTTCFSLLTTEVVLKENPVTADAASPTTILAQNANGSLQRGQSLSVDGKTFPVSWVQWREGEQLRTGISDLGAMKVLGIELLDTTQPQSQPIQWFSGVINLTTRFITPHRYLDLTEWLDRNGLQTRVQGDNLLLSLTGSQILEIREGKQPWGKRIVLTLSRPAFWQVSQNPTEAVVSLGAIAAAKGGNPGANRSLGQTDQDDLGGGNASPSNKEASFSVEGGGMGSKIHVTLPMGNKLQVTSLENPYRLVLDVRPDALQPKTIAWTPGVTWRQDLINRGSDRFPVTWLELDLANPNVKLKPITSTPNTVIGSVPLTTMVNTWQASAGINAGFFNRQNKFPLGAIKQDNRWLSGPILQRGAIAWNERGEFAIARLSLQETITTRQGQRLKVDFLNSGYVQKGLARYTSDWGSNYTPATNNEVITIVQNNQVISQQNGGQANQLAFPIPQEGYLLTLRGNTISPDLLAVGTPLTLESATFPPSFNNYPQIIGAGPLLIDQGRIVLDAVAEGFNPAFQQQTASRSAIAVNAAGKFCLVAIHNRVGGKGATLGETAAILQQMGMRSALNLDGGSSTALALGGQLIDRSAVTAAKVNNGLGLFVSP